MSIQSQIPMPKYLNRDRKLRDLTLALVTMTILAAFAINQSGCNYTINGNPNVDLTGASISPIAATVTESGVLQLTGQVQYFSGDTSLSFSIVGGGAGQISSNGSIATYVAPSTLLASSTITIRATSNANPAVHADCLVTILAQNPSDTVTGIGVTINPIAVTLGRGRSQLFNVVVSGTNDSTIRWSTYGGAAQITQNGLFSLSGSTGVSKVSYLIAKSHADSNIFALATILIGIPGDSTICFTNTIQPMLLSNCTGSGCHGTGQRGGFNPDSYEGVIRDVRSGNASNSPLYQRVVELNANNRMPPLPQQSLSPLQVRLLGQWIDQGAPNTDCK